MKQQVRDSSQLLQDYVIVATVASFMGVILKYSDSVLGGSTLIQESILALGKTFRHIVCYLLHCKA